MMERNNFDFEGMHVDLFLPSQQAGEGTIIPSPAHGARIVTLQSGEEDVGGCDALITMNRAMALGVRTADCAPVCLSDGGIIGIAHVGWRGLCEGLVEKMLTQFDASVLTAYVGPFLHSFEIQKDACYDRLTEKFGGRFIKQEDGILRFYFKDALSSLLPPQTVYDARDTAEDASFPSHRRDGTKDRFTTVVHFPTV